MSETIDDWDVPITGNERDKGWVVEYDSHGNRIPAADICNSMKQMKASWHDRTLKGEHRPAPSAEALERARQLTGKEWPAHGEVLYRSVVEALAFTRAKTGLTRPMTRTVAYSLIGLCGFDHPTIEYAEAIVVRARRSGLIPLHSVTDGRSESSSWYTTETADVAASALSMVGNTRFDRQDGQDNLVEVIVEAKGSIAPLRALCAEFGVRLHSGSGGVPLTLIHDIAERDPSHVLVHTDLDEPGIKNIFVPVARDLVAFNPSIEVVRFATTPDQALEALAESGAPAPPAPDVDWWLPASDGTMVALPTAELALHITVRVLRELLEDLLPDRARRALIVRCERLQSQRSTGMLARHFDPTEEWTL